MNLNSSTFVCFVILQILLAFTFITVFFFTYGKTLEKQAIINNIDYLIENIFGNGNLNLPEDIKTEFINKIKGDTETHNENDKKVNENNKKILNNTLLILIILITVVLLFIIFSFSMRNSNIHFFQNFNLTKILRESGIILIFVGLTEFCFLYFFASKYIVVNSNLLKKQVVDKLGEYSNS